MDWVYPLGTLCHGLGLPLAQLVLGWDNPSHKLHCGLGQPLRTFSWAGTTPHASFVVGWDNPSCTSSWAGTTPHAPFVVGWDNPSRNLLRGLGQPLTHIVVGWDNPSRKPVLSRAGITPRTLHGLGFTPHRFPHVYKLFILICLIVVSVDPTTPRPTRPPATRNRIKASSSDRQRIGSKRPPTTRNRIDASSRDKESNRRVLQRQRIGLLCLVHGLPMVPALLMMAVSD